MASQEQAQGGFWKRVGGATATAFEKLSDLYVAREVYTAFPESVSTSTRPTTLDYAVTEQPPQAIPSTSGRLQGAPVPFMQGSTGGISNQMILIGAVGLVGIWALTR